MDTSVGASRGTAANTSARASSSEITRRTVAALPAVASTLSAVTFDLLIFGTGSGNTILSPEFDDWSVAIVEEGMFGGTCLTRGCIPTKMFVYAADLVSS